MPPLLSLRARAEIERRRRLKEQFDRTRFDPTPYIEKWLGWSPWAGTPGHPGQTEVLDAYVLALRQQHERQAYEAGELAESELEYWTPGQTIKNRLRVEAGHTVGKTKLASAIVNHFYDHFAPAVGYCFAPGWDQIHDLLFKEIKADREGKGLPGRILDLELRRAHNHFVKGKATDNAHGKGSHRVHGQHERYLIFVIDEGEGVADFVFDAVDSMTSGGISIVLMLANPQTRTSRFHKAGSHSDTRSFRISCLHHPNVIAGREIVPGAVKRQYVEKMTEKHCQVVTRHNPDDHTFTLPYDVTVKGKSLPAGTIFLPDAEYMFRVMGEAPANTSDKTLIPTGRYEAAVNRPVRGLEPYKARLGLDVAGFGNDKGTLYVNHDLKVWRARQMSKLDQVEYYEAVKAECLKLARAGCWSIHVRIDAGGGFGGGVAALLRRDLDLRQTVKDFQVFEVNFNGSPYDRKSFADSITEMTAGAAEVLRVCNVVNPPEELMADLCEREYDWVIKEGRSVKKLDSKDDFRKTLKPERSPDDGDGFVLSVAPDHLVGGKPTKQSNYKDS